MGIFNNADLYAFVLQAMNIRREVSYKTKWRRPICCLLLLPTLFDYKFYFDWFDLILGDAM